MTNDTSNVPRVDVESKNGLTTIEVVSDDASDVFKRLFDALDPTVERAQRIAIEIEEEYAAAVDEEQTAVDEVETEVDEHQAAVDEPEAWEGEAEEEDEEPEPEPEPEMDLESGNGFDGKIISANTALHEVAWALRTNPPMRSGDLITEMDTDYASGTVTSSLTIGKKGHLFKQVDDDVGVGKWTLTDWGQAEISRLGPPNGEEKEAAHA